MEQTDGMTWWHMMTSAEGLKSVILSYLCMFPTSIVLCIHITTFWSMFMEIHAGSYYCSLCIMGCTCYFLNCHESEQAANIISFVCIYLLAYLFETAWLCVLAGLERTILLPLLLEGWGCRCKPLCLAIQCPLYGGGNWGSVGHLHSVTLQLKRQQQDINEGVLCQSPLLGMTLSLLSITEL